MKNENQISSRRGALKKMAGTTAMAMVGSSLSYRLAAAESVLDSIVKGKNQSFGLPVVL